MELLAGAALGSAFSELLKAVIDQTQQTVEFNTHLTRLETTLKRLEPLFNNDITELNKMLNRSVEETTQFTSILEKGKELVIKCSRIKAWNVFDRRKYARKLIELDKELLRFFQIDAQAILVITGFKILNKVSTPTSSAGAIRFSGSCSVPGLPQFVIGMDQRLAELKDVLLKDETRLLVISAPGGFGKTTLAKMLCHDLEIIGIFGDNILYVTVSTETSIMNIAKKLFKHYDIDDLDFNSEEDAKNQIENLIKQKGSSKMLLVIDDVWSKSESVIEDLKFEIPGFKILVTSRSQILKFSSTTYDLRLLNTEDAKTLFCHSAFPHDGSHVNNVRDDLVNKMVEFCKGIPLALTVVGASLCGRPEVIWKATLKKWFEGQSILESHRRLLLCLRTSIDALDELPKNCFLDFGSFPEDDKISGMALMDMWVELYKLDDEGVYAAENLLYLKSRNLINLVEFRKAAGETEGHCRQYHMTQHDVLRDLAIHMSKQEPATERKRLFIEINSNNFPEWWIQVAQQPVNARLLSISTDEEFNSTWCDLNAPNVKVLILNIRSKNYTLPRFIERMSQLKVLIVTGYGVYPTQLDNLQVLASLSKLSRIRFELVSVSASVQVIFTLKTLKKLTFVMCKIGNALNTRPTEYRYMLENLKDLEIDSCLDLKQLPAELCSSVHLQKLVITYCHELNLLPEDLGNLSNLEILRLNWCIGLKKLPESIGSLRKLKLIDISHCWSITALPEQIGELSSLRVIDIRRCNRLDKLPMTVTRLKQLEDVWCDEEGSYMWKNIESDLCNVKINIVKMGYFLTLNNFL